jgi:probable rRNA maturation factor
MPVFVNNLQEKTKMDSKLLENINFVVETSLKVENRVDDPEVSIALVDDNYIREINYKFRHIDQPTDVLSFSMSEIMEDEPVLVDNEENILGDIIISLEATARQAEEYEHSFERELAYLATHGMMHLLGYDHDNESNRRTMREREEKVLSILNITR